MVFSIGNLITLVIVLLILFVYRTLDKNNRSLEKVKKYSDKIRQDLDHFVDQRTRELQNTAVEVDVHQQAGRELLKRVSAIEEGLSGRADDIEGLYNRIAEYDQSLVSLKEMSDQVNENLQHLEEESEFVDKVGRRIKETARRIEDLEKRIPGLADEFASRTDQALDQTRQQVLSEAGTVMDSLKDDVEHARYEVNEFSEKVQSAETRVETLADQTFISIDKRLDETVNQASRRGDEIRDRLGEDLDLFSERITERQQKASSDIEALDRDLAGRMAESRASLEAQMETFRTEAASGEAYLHEKLEAFQTRSQEIEDDYLRHLKTAADRGLSLEDEIFGELKGRVENRARNVEKELSGILNGTKDRIQKGNSDLMNLFGEVRSQTEVWKTNLTKEMEETASRLNQERAAQEKTLNTQSAEFIKKHFSVLEAQVKKVSDFVGESNTSLASLSERLDEKGRQLAERQQSWEETLSSRMESIRQGLSETLKAKEKDLQTSMDQWSSTFSQRVKEEQTSVQEGWALLRSQFDASMEELKVRTQDIANETSESLGGRIDQWNDKLTDNLKSAEQRLLDYQDDMTARFTRMEEVSRDVDTLEARLMETVERESRKLQQEFLHFEESLAQQRAEEVDKAQQVFDGVRGRMQELEQELSDLKQGAYDNVSENLKVFEDDFFQDLKDRSASMEGRFHTWEETVNDRLARLEQERVADREELAHNYLEEMGQRVESLKSSGDQQLATSRDHVAVRLSDFEKEMNLAMAEKSTAMETMMASARQSLDQWQSSMADQLSAAEEKTLGDLSSYKGGMDQNLEALRTAYAAEREELVTRSVEDRERLSRELKAMAESVVNLESELASRSESALQAFEQSHDAFSLKLSETIKEIKDEIDTRYRAFKAAGQETQEKIDAVQDRLYGRVEENCRNLSSVLQDIDKRIKAFTAQTRIFDRADTLKNQLNQAIEEMKSELLRLNGESRALKDTEKQMVKIRKLEEEVSGRLGRFNAERRRIEAMEGDFTRLLALSQTIDGKLEELTSSDDRLTSYQARLRQLEELSQRVETMYQRLESKSQVLETTVTGVDTGFEKLNELDRRMGSLAEAADSFPSVLDDIQKRLGVLSKEKERADEAVDKVLVLDQHLGDVESRLDEMQKAREWLARTETRLDDVNRQAQQQVKLLEALVKDGAKKRKSDSGDSVSMDERDVVRRLAHQGWSIQEISRVTKLSRSEVELILELPART